LARYVDEQNVDLLFGCSSFAGTETARYTDAFALLTERHLAPARWLPQVKAPRVIRFAQGLAGRVPDVKNALRAMPPVLRSYIAMGGSGRCMFSPLWIFAKFPRPGRSCCGRRQPEPAREPP
jgi:hypothetical protein